MDIAGADERSAISTRFGYDLDQSGRVLPFATARGPLLQDLQAHSRQFRPDDNTHAHARPAPPSRFEQIAAASAGISPHRVRLLGILLAAATPASAGGRAELRPVWANEAIHRAYNMVRLVGRLDRRMPRHDQQSPAPDFETRLAVRLAATFDQLAITHDGEPRPCSVPLRNVARDLVELFGPGVGEISVATHVDRLTLPAFQHRALILLASELVTNCLLHAFNVRRSGRIELQLIRHHGGAARLTVADGGNYACPDIGRVDGRCGVAEYLADLLASRLVYRPAVGAGTVADIDIPVA